MKRGRKPKQVVRKVGRPKKDEVVRKVGRPKKDKTIKTVEQIAKLGKRKYKRAIEEMAMTKINKKLQKERTKEMKKGTDTPETISSREGREMRGARIMASPTLNSLAVRDGRVAKMYDKLEKNVTVVKEKKDPKLGKVILNRYLKKLKEKGHQPVNVKVLENKPDYFKIEFNEGKNGELITCYHYKAWE